MKIHFYCPDGSSTFTENVDESEIASHINGRTHLWMEAAMLMEFISSCEIPETLSGGAFRKVAEGMSKKYENTPFVTYSDD